MNAIPASISPLIRRHAEDAAFYWSQLDRSSEAFTLGGRRALHFAHLPKPQTDRTDARDLTAREVSVAYGWDASRRKAQLDEAYCKMYSCDQGKSCDQKLKDAKVVPHSGMPGGGPREKDADNL